jgi:hypothetical protein
LNILVQHPGRQFKAIEGRRTPFTTAYTRYIAAERRAKYPDMFVMKTVYERAIAEATK